MGRDPALYGPEIHSLYVSKKSLSRYEQTEVVGKDPLWLKKHSLS
jgi:hypothetical protein